MSVKISQTPEFTKSGLLHMPPKFDMSVTNSQAPEFTKSVRLHMPPNVHMSVNSSHAHDISKSVLVHMPNIHMSGNINIGSNRKNQYWALE